MAIVPIVRDFLACEDVHVDLQDHRRITILGLINNIQAKDENPYPLTYRELCVFLALTDCSGTRDGWIVCVIEETGEVVFATAPRPIPFSPDRLQIVGVLFRIQDCRFPLPGLYSIQFWYDGVRVSERPLRLR